MGEEKTFVIHVGFNATIKAATAAGAVQHAANKLYPFDGNQVENLKLNVNYEVIPVEVPTQAEERTGDYSGKQEAATRKRSSLGGDPGTIAYTEQPYRAGESQRNSHP